MKPNILLTQYNYGRWNKKERDLFLNHYIIHKNNWKLISRLIKTRSAIQVRTHFQKLNKKIQRDAYLLIYLKNNNYLF
jgi:hypothetical protein